MKQSIKLGAYLLITALLLGSCTPPQQNEEVIQEENWTPLFNGTDLSGWEIKIAGHEVNDNYKSTFQVEDSMLRVKYDQYETFDNSFGHIFFKTPYSMYKLRLQYRILGDSKVEGSPDWSIRNSGIMIHSQSASSMDLNQFFPISLEAQLLGGIDDNNRPTGNICTPGTQIHMGDQLQEAHCIFSNSKTYGGDQWVKIIIEVYGDSLVRHIVENDTVVTYSKPIIGGGYVNEALTWKSANITDSSSWISKAGIALREGYIGLQAEGHPIDFRKIELLNLEKLSNQ